MSSFTKASFWALFASLTVFGALGQVHATEIPREIVHPIVHRPSALHSNGIAAAQDPFPDTLTITVNSTQRALQLELTKSKNLFATNYSHDMIHVLPDGTISRKKSHTLPQVDCFYHGKVIGDENSIVSIDFCSNSMSGYITTGDGNTVTIEPTEVDIDTNTDTNTNTNTNTNTDTNTNVNAIRTGPIKQNTFIDPDTDVENIHVKSVDIAAQAPHYLVNATLEETQLRKEGLISSCGVLEADNSTEHTHTFSLTEAIKSNSEESNNTNTHAHSHAETGNSVLPAYEKPKRYVELLVFNDNQRFRTLGSKTSLTTLQLVNDIASYYRNANFKYDVEVVLKGQVTFTESDPYSIPYKADGSVRTMGNEGLLNTFNWYRATYANYLPSHDIGMLLSALNFEDNIRGLANVGSICMHPSATGNINQVTFRSRVMNAVTAAHELGHNLGSPHDNHTGYIMQPYVGVDTKFSPASKSYIEQNMRTRTCMNNNPFEGVRESSMIRSNQSGYESGFFTSQSTQNTMKSGFSIFGLSQEISLLVLSLLSATGSMIVFFTAFKLCASAKNNKANDDGDDTKKSVNNNNNSEGANLEGRVFTCDNDSNESGTESNESTATPQSSPSSAASSSSASKNKIGHRRTKSPFRRNVSVSLGRNEVQHPSIITSEEYDIESPRVYTSSPSNPSTPSAPARPSRVSNPSSVYTYDGYDARSPAIIAPSPRVAPALALKPGNIMSVDTVSSPIVTSYPMKSTSTICQVSSLNASI